MTAITLKGSRITLCPLCKKPMKSMWDGLKGWLMCEWGGCPQRPIYEK